MLRVGLTGGLGSGKSTAARIFAEHGAYVFYADEIGRSLMQPGEEVYAAISARFGPSVVKLDGLLDRPALARMAFEGGRLEELNAIVHPATIAKQAELIAAVAARDANAVVIVESALIFETKYGGEGGWAKRFDRIIFVQAADELKIARFVERSADGRTLSADQRTTLTAEAQRRLAQQAGSERNAQRSDYVLINDGSLEKLRAQVDAVWLELKALTG
jgi:dephospho-CoA kinase